MPDAVPGQDARRLRDDADFRRYWWSRLLSTTGSIISYIALPVLVYRMSGSALLTALVTAMETGSYVLFGLSPARSPTGGTAASSWYVQRSRMHWSWPPCLWRTGSGS